MPLFYKPTQASLPDKEGNKLWFPCLVKTGYMIDLDVLAQRLCEYSNVMPGEVHNVVRNLMSIMITELQNGNSVKLNGMGTFTLKVRSKGNGVMTADEVSPSQITGLRCMFTPEYFRPSGLNTTRAIENGVVFKHIDTMKHGYDSNSSNTGNNGGDDGGGGFTPDPNA